MLSNGKVRTCAASSPARAASEGGAAAGPGAREVGVDVEPGGGACSPEDGGRCGAPAGSSHSTLARRPSAGLHSAHHPQRSGRDAHGNRHGRTAAAAAHRTTWSATGSSSPGSAPASRGRSGSGCSGRAARCVGEDSAQSSGGGIGVGDFSARVRRDRPAATGHPADGAGLRRQPRTARRGPVARLRPARGRGDLLPRVARLPALPGRVRRHPDRHRPQAQGPSPRSPSSRSWPPTPGSRTPT